MKMKKVLKTTGVFASVVLISTMIRWDYIIHFMNLSYFAAQQLVQGEEVPREFNEIVNHLEIGQFINLSFLDELIQEE